MVFDRFPISDLPVRVHSTTSAPRLLALQKGKGINRVCCLACWFYEHSTRSKQASLCRCRVVKIKLNCHCSIHTYTSVYFTPSCTIVFLCALLSIIIHWYITLHIHIHIYVFLPVRTYVYFSYLDRFSVFTDFTFLEEAS